MSNSILSTWKKQITSNLIATVKELYPEYQEDILKEITHAKTLELGDLSLPCFTIAKALKLAPPLIAKTIAEKIYLPNFIEKTVAVGPYVNIFFNRALFKNKVLENIFSKKDSLGKGTDSETIVLEYSSPNIAKSLHVGHLRTTLIGLCLERVLKHLGNKVHTINHLGDWGTQFGYVYAGCELFGKPKDPTIDDLVELYIKASSIRKEQDIAKGDKEKLKPEHRDLPIIKEMAEKYFIRLEAGDKEATEFWQWCLDVSLKYLKQNYERLGIFFDNYTGESFYSKMIPGVEKMIKDAGILEDSEGALGITLNEELGFVRIFTEDGRSLYITRDIAAAVYRHEHFKPVKNLYIVAAQQSLHFQQLKEIMTRLNHPSANEIVHIPFGFVPGMSTRAGGAISFNDYLNKAKETALETYRKEVEKRPEDINEDEVAEKVAIGSTYFYFLKHSNIKDFHFSWDHALSFSGDAGPYVQYTYARLNSITAKAEAANITAATITDATIIPEDLYYLTTILGKFEETITSVATSYEPNYLAEYLAELAREVSSCYKKFRVVGEDAEKAAVNLAVFAACKQVLGVGMNLLGVPVIERM